jgi:hypothetical protein
VPQRLLSPRWGSDPQRGTNDRDRLRRRREPGRPDSARTTTTTTGSTHPTDTGDGELARNGRNLATTYNYGPDLTIGRRSYRSKAAQAKVGAGRTAQLKVAFGRGATQAIRRALERGTVKATVTLAVGAASTKRVVTPKA